MTKKLAKTEIIIGFIVFALALLYAFFNDWHYDEAYTLSSISNATVKDIAFYTKFKLANNHIINSLYFKLIYSLNLHHYIFYRLLSLAGLLIFIYGNIKLFDLLKINKIFLIFVLITPYFRYFALGRGYALAMASFTMALVHLLLFKQTHKQRHGYAFILWGIISSISVFSFVYGVVSLYIVYLSYNRKKLLSIHLVIQLLLFSFTLFYIYKVGKVINNTSNIICGKGFFNGSVNSLIEFFYRALNFYYIPLLKKYDIELKILTTIFLVVPFLTLFWERKRKEFINKISELTLILFFSLLLIFLGHIITGAKYPVYRAIMYLHYSLLLLLILTYQTYKRRVYLIPLILFLLIYLIFSYRLFNNLTYLSNKKIIEQTGNYPIIYVSHNTNLKVLNTSKTKKIYDITNYKRINQLLKTKIHSDYSYILISSKDTAYLKYNNKWTITKIKQARNERLFIELRRRK